MRVHYSGPIDRVSIPLPNGREVEVAKGHDVDLGEHLPAKEAEAIGKSLLRQGDNWTPASEPAKPGKKEG